jgi:hypothetical protein
LAPKVTQQGFFIPFASSSSFSSYSCSSSFPSSSSTSIVEENLIELFSTRRVVRQDFLTPPYCSSYSSWPSSSSSFPIEKIPTELLFMLKVAHWVFLSPILPPPLLLGECTLRWTKNGTCGVHSFTFLEFKIWIFGVLRM